LWVNPDVPSLDGRRDFTFYRGVSINITLEDYRKEILATGEIAISNLQQLLTFIWNQASIFKI